MFGDTRGTAVPPEHRPLPARTIARSLQKSIGQFRDESKKIIRSLTHDTTCVSSRANIGTAELAQNLALLPYLTARSKAR